MDLPHAIAKLIGIISELEPGTVSLVGAGPGDSGLISVRGAVRLMQADVVLHDKLIGPELLELVRPDAERIFVGKWRGEHVWTQEEINAALVVHARAGRRVVRLKGGDPFVFGRGGEECEAMAAAGVRFEVVPGITAAFGAPAAAGIPLTHRGLSRSVALVSGHVGGQGEGERGGEGEKEKEGAGERIDYAALARMDTIALYMGVKYLEVHCRGLMAAGLDAGTPAAVIHWGSRPQQRTIAGTLADIAGRVAGADIRPPAMVLIGQVVRLRETIEWFERRPLHGQVIVVTRMRDQAAALSGPLRAAGAEVIEAPTIELAPAENLAPVDEALGQVAGYQWLVVTSTNGVDATFERLKALGRDSRALAGVKVAAIGPATADRLRQKGIEPDLVPPEAVGEAMAESLIAQGVQGQRVLLLRADIAREQLATALREAGAVCDDLPIYRTVCPKALPEAFLERFDRGGIDWITLTSPSSFNSLLALLGEVRAAVLHKIRLASIGPVTTRAIVGAGYAVAAEADPHDVPGLVRAIERAGAGA